MLKFDETEEKSTPVVFLLSTIFSLFLLKRKTIFKINFYIEVYHECFVTAITNIFSFSTNFILKLAYNNYVLVLISLFCLFVLFV